MADNIFLVTFDLNQDDGSLNSALWGNFDIHGMSQVFNNLDDAKAWILDIVKNDILDVDDSLSINPDLWHDTDFGDILSIFGTGSGALMPWLSVSDCGDTIVRFWIHQVDVH